MTIGPATMFTVSDFGAEVSVLISCTVTLKLKGVPAAFVGVPLIAPVAASSDSPGGNAPELITQLLNGGAPVLPSNVAAYGTPTSPPGNELVVIVTPELIFMHSPGADEDEVAPALSLTLTTKQNGFGLAALLVGVPLIAPVAGSKFSPGGSPPELIFQLL